MFRCTGVTHKQTELEYAYSLWSREGSACRGPLIKLRLRGFAYEEISAALSRVGAADVLRSTATEELTEEGGHFQMCAAHWFDVAGVLGGMAEAHENPVWDKLNSSLFMLTSRSAGWDFREMQNRLTSFKQAKLAGT